jgi:hypothetical protein
LKIIISSVNRGEKFQNEARPQKTREVSEKVHDQFQGKGVGLLLMLVYLTENPYITRSKYVELCVEIFGGLFFLNK